MPIDEAVEYMKAAAKKSYSKKGDAVVEMNYKAIDAGVDAVHKVEVPESWKNPEADAPKAEQAQDVQRLLSLLTSFLIQSLRWMVTAFQFQHSRICADGQYRNRCFCIREERNSRYGSCSGIQTSCIQCNNCAFVCSHATIQSILTYR